MDSQRSDAFTHIERIVQPLGESYVEILGGVRFRPLLLQLNLISGIPTDIVHSKRPILTLYDIFNRSTFLNYGDAPST